MTLGNSFSKIGRKKNNFVGDVSFKLYLCHSLNSIPKITIFGGHNKARACESSGFNVLNSKMAQNGLLTQPLARYMGFPTLCAQTAQVKTSVAPPGRNLPSKDGADTIQEEGYICNAMQLCSEPFHL
jgi:hypothetical protein